MIRLIADGNKPASALAYAAISIPLMAKEALNGSDGERL